MQPAASKSKFFPGGFEHFVSMHHLFFFWREIHVSIHPCTDLADASEITSPKGRYKNFHRDQKNVWGALQN